MVNTKTVRNQMNELFESAQQTTACHLKNAILLKKIIDTGDFNETIAELRNIFKVFMLCDYKLKSIHYIKTTEFIAHFCKILEPKVSENEDIEDHPILLQIFDFLLYVQDNVKEQCRYWACYLIKTILSNFDSLSDDLWDRIRIAMLQRILDPKPEIRLEALSCLVFFQNPKDQNDEITAEFTELLNDSSAKIRAFVLEHIAITQEILPKIIVRVRDIDPKVRFKAFTCLGKFMKYIGIVKRQSILRSGINETDKKVQQYFSTIFLNIWLESYNGNYLNLIKSILLDADDNDIFHTCQLTEIVLRKLFVNKTLNELRSVLELNKKKLINFEHLTFESVLYWRILAEYLYDQPEAEEIIPECVLFCKYIRQFLNEFNNEQLHKKFILKQLFLIAKTFDLADNMSRGCLHKLILDIMEKEELNLELVDVLFENLSIIHLNPQNLIVECCEIISTIKYPDKEQILAVNQTNILDQTRVMKNHIDELQRLLDEAVRASNFDKAEELDSKIQEEKSKLEEQSKLLEANEQDNECVWEKTTDPKSILKYLTIMQGLLRSPKITKVTPEIHMLYAENIRDHLLNRNEEICIKALLCCALVAILDKKIAKNIIHWYSALITGNNEVSDELLSACIKSVVDLLSVHGCDLVAQSDGDDTDSQREEHIEIFVGGTSLTQLIQKIVDLINHESLEIQHTATKGICNLLRTNRIRSTSIIVRLILIWANPSTDSNFVRPYIGCTLGTISQLPKFWENLQDAVPLVIRTIINAPDSSPLVDVDPKHIAKFMIELCLTSDQYSKIYFNLIWKILREISDDPSDIVVAVYLKMLLMINLTEIDVDDVEDWLAVCDKIYKVLDGKSLKNDILKFKSKLSLLLDVENDDGEDNDNEISTATTTNTTVPAE